MALHMENVPQSCTNQKYFEIAWNEMHWNIQRPTQGLSTPEIIVYDHSLPAYNEIHNNIERSMPITFDQISLPSYESAVNGSIRRPETPVPIPESLVTELANPLEIQKKCCCINLKHMKYFASGVVFVIILAILCIFYLIFKKIK